MEPIKVTEELLNDLRNFRSRQRLPYWDIVDVYCDKERVAKIAGDFIDQLINYLSVNPTWDWVLQQSEAALDNASYEEGEGREHLKLEVDQVLGIVDSYRATPRT